MTLFLESPCSHGRMARHCKHGDTDDHIEPVPGELGACDVSCPGGSRTEVTLNMAAVIDYLIEELAIDEVADRETILVHAYNMEQATLGDRL